MSSKSIISYENIKSYNTIWEHTHYFDFTWYYHLNYINLKISSHNHNRGLKKLKPQVKFWNRNCGLLKFHNRFITTVNFSNNLTSAESINFVRAEVKMNLYLVISTNTMSFYTSSNESSLICTIYYLIRHFW